MRGVIWGTANAGKSQAMPCYLNTLITRVRVWYYIESVHV